MTIPDKREAIRVVCPHCRRTYVFKADLKQIYRTKPRAVCSRCGGKFEVIQRMLEIEEPLMETRVGLQEFRRRRVKRTIETSPAPTPDPPHENRPDAATTTYRSPLHTQVEKNVTTIGHIQLPQTQPKEQENPAQSQAVPSHQNVEESRDILLSPGLPHTSDQSALTATPPSNTSWPSGRIMPPSLPLWTVLPQIPQPSGVRAPRQKDLERPIPWPDHGSPTLDTFDVQLPTSAKLLVWLLTEGHPSLQEASPPPASPDTRSR